MQIRKIFTQIEDIQSEAGRDADTPLRKVAVVAVVKNPFAGQPYREDLSDLTDASAAVTIVSPASTNRNGTSG